MKRVSPWYIVSSLRLMLWLGSETARQWIRRRRPAGIVRVVHSTPYPVCSWGVSEEGVTCMAASRKVRIYFRPGYWN